MKQHSIISTAFGNIKITAEKESITHCQWTREKVSQSPVAGILSEAEKQLRFYFDKKLKKFDLLLNPEGTAFQKSVWQALINIPYGKTCSYRDIAKNIGFPKAARAVGNANGKNPICIFIPCHRVILSSGGIGGYSAGLPFKEKLLKMENL